MLSQNELKEILLDSLGELGLTEHEVNLYTLSLSSGPSSVATLAKLLGITRPNIYKVIAGLEKHGLAKFSDRKKFQRTFMVESPAKVQELLRQKREAIGDFDRKVTTAMPDLLALYQQGELPTSIRVFQGTEDFKKLFFGMLEETREEMHFFGSAKDFLGLVTWASEREWIKRRLEKKLFIKVLLLPSEDTTLIGSTDAKEMRETRVFNAVPPFVSSFHIFGKKLVFWQPQAPLAVLIEDEYIVAMMRAAFSFMWEMSAPAKEPEKVEARPPLTPASQ